MQLLVPGKTEDSESGIKWNKTGKEWQKAMYAEGCRPKTHSPSLGAERNSELARA